MLLSKTFAVPVEPVKKSHSVVTSDQRFFDPGTSTSGLSSGVTVGGTSSSLVQTTGDPAVFIATHLLNLPVPEVLLLPVRVLPALLRVPVRVL